MVYITINITIDFLTTHSTTFNMVRQANSELVYIKLLLNITVFY